MTITESLTRLPVRPADRSAQKAAARLRRAARARHGAIAYHTAGAAIMLFFLAPFVIAGLSSFRNGTEAQTAPLPPWPKSGFSVDSYRTLDSF